MYRGCRSEGLQHFRISFFGVRCFGAARSGRIDSSPLVFDEPWLVEFNVREGGKSCI